jgi:hypothetical protein
VFILLGGSINRSWGPIGCFRESHEIPCLFSSTDHPGAEDAGRPAVVVDPRQLAVYTGVPGPPSGSGLHPGGRKPAPLRRDRCRRQGRGLHRHHRQHHQRRQLHDRPGAGRRRRPVAAGSGGDPWRQPEQLALRRRADEHRRRCSRGRGRVLPRGRGQRRNLRYSPPAVGGLAIATSTAAPLLWMRTYTEEPATGGGTVTYGQAILPRTAAATVTPAAGGGVVVACVIRHAVSQGD